MLVIRVWNSHYHSMVNLILMYSFVIVILWSIEDISFTEKRGEAVVVAFSPNERFSSFKLTIKILISIVQREKYFTPAANFSEQSNS